MNTKFFMGTPWALQQIIVSLFTAFKNMKLHVTSAKTNHINCLVNKQNLHRSNQKSLVLMRHGTRHYLVQKYIIRYTEANTNIGISLVEFVSIPARCYMSIFESSLKARVKYPHAPSVKIFFQLVVPAPKTAPLTDNECANHVFAS